MKFLKILAGLMITVLCVGVLVFAYGYWISKKSLPQLSGTIRISGLSAPVTVYRDSNGVPHIEAQNLDDMALAQGYVTAQDRLWQMDIFRRNAKGELAEVLGPVALPFDEEHRRLGFPEAAEQAVLTMDSESRQALDHYAEGVNAFILSHSNNLPIEFQLLRYKPRPWMASDSLSIALMMSETLNNTWERDIFRGKLLDKFGPEILEDLYPTHSHYEIPLVGTDTPNSPDANPAPAPSFPGNLNSQERSFRLVASDSFSFDSPLVSLLWCLTPERSVDSVLDSLQNLSRPPADSTVGSNNWVVNGTHSKTGKPLLANDPHLAHSIPSIWYQAQMHTPQIDVVGVTLAGAPGVIIGHNEHIAWGMTNLNPDVQDVYQEQFNTEQGIKYLANGQWIDAQVRTERIRIKGKADEILSVLVTRHGPVMIRQGVTGYALKWTALEPNGIGFPFLRLDRASNWKEFTSTLAGFYGPAQNFVYADDQGNIGFYDAGKIPIRRSGLGNVPVPGGSDNYEWVGYVPFEALPHLFNPPEGIIATANQRVVGDSYPYFITTDWGEAYRFARIHQLLTAQATFSRDDFLKIQGDVYSIANKVLADLVVHAAERVSPQTQIAIKAVDRLARGNFIATPQNVETTIIEYVRRQVEEVLLRNVLGDQWRDYRSDARALFVENQLTQRPARWLPSEYKSYDELLVRSLEQVCKQLQSVYSSEDPSSWAWGKYYPLLFRHPLGRFWPLDRFFKVGPFQQPGTKQTIKQTTSSIGPSMRMVVDFANLDRSYNNLTLGESGQPLSPYYSNQIHHWLEDKSYLMPFSEAAVKRSAVNMLVLQP